VGIDPEALALVERWQDRRRARGINGKAPLFCTLQGARLSGQHVRQMLKRRAAKAGIEKRVSPHAFRHTLSAEWVEEGRTLQQIQAQLGHASLDGTAHYLRKIAPVDLVQIARERPAWGE
jgi:integrase/recombinase XerD